MKNVIGPNGRLLRHVRRCWPSSKRKRQAMQLLYSVRQVTHWAEIRLFLNGEELHGVTDFVIDYPIGVCERAWTEES